MHELSGRELRDGTNNNRENAEIQQHRNAAEKVFELVTVFNEVNDPDKGSANLLQLFPPNIKTYDRLCKVFGFEVAPINNLEADDYIEACRTIATHEQAKNLQRMGLRFATGEQQNALLTLRIQNSDKFVQHLQSLPGKPNNLRTVDGYQKILQSYVIPSAIKKDIAVAYLDDIRQRYSHLYDVFLPGYALETYRDYDAALADNAISPTLHQAFNRSKEIGAQYKRLGISGFSAKPFIQLGEYYQEGTLPEACLSAWTNILDAPINPVVTSDATWLQIDEILDETRKKAANGKLWQTLGANICDGLRHHIIKMNQAKEDDSALDELTAHNTSPYNYYKGVYGRLTRYRTMFES